MAIPEKDIKPELWITCEGDDAFPAYTKKIVKVAEGCVKYEDKTWDRICDMTGMSEFRIASDVELGLAIGLPGVCRAEAAFKTGDRVEIIGSTSIPHAFCVGDVGYLQDRHYLNVEDDCCAWAISIDGLSQTVAECDLRFVSRDVDDRPCSEAACNAADFGNVMSVPKDRTTLKSARFAYAYGSPMLAGRFLKPCVMVPVETPSRMLTPWPALPVDTMAYGTEWDKSGIDHILSEYTNARVMRAIDREYIPFSGLNSDDPVITFIEDHDRLCGVSESVRMRPKALSIAELFDGKPYLTIRM